MNNTYPNNWQQMQNAAPPVNAPATPIPNWNRPNFTMAPSIPGRMVGNPQEIRPNEVPMDGTAAFFPMNDYSCIYIKAWGADGNIQTLRFIPEVVEQAPQGPSQFDQVMARLDSIEQTISNRYNKRNNNPKKEGDNG